MNDCIVLAGGDQPLDSARHHLPLGALVIAADSGFEHAKFLGLHVDLVIGDMDSISSIEELSETRRIVHPVDKDQTDLELALRHAVHEEHCNRIFLVGGIGGRFDHTVTNLGLIAAEWLAGVDLEWIAGTAKIRIVRDEVTIKGDPLELVSLIPIGGTAQGVTTSGLRWELDNEDLLFGSTRGTGNLLIETDAIIQVRSGILALIRPSAIS